MKITRRQLKQVIQKTINEGYAENDESSRMPLSIETLHDLNRSVGVTLFRVVFGDVEEISSDPEEIMEILSNRFGMNAWFDYDEITGRVYKDDRRTNFAVRNI